MRERGVALTELIIIVPVMVLIALFLHDYCVLAAQRSKMQELGRQIVRDMHKRCVTEEADIEYLRYSSPSPDKLKVCLQDTLGAFVTEIDSRACNILLSTYY